MNETSFQYRETCERFELVDCNERRKYWRKAFSCYRRDEGDRRKNGGSAMGAVPFFDVSQLVAEFLNFSFFQSGDLNNTRQIPPFA